MATTTDKPVWLITGCSSGLGQALASYVLGQNHRLMVTSRTPSQTPDLVAEVESKGGQWMELDVTSEDVEKAISKAESFFGRLDVVVNNAGYAVMGAVEDTPLSEITAQMNVNFYGPVRVMQAVLPGMRQRGSGTIINVSSAQGLCPSPANGIYAASKAALEAASESLSQEVEPFGIRVVLAELGAFRTTFGSVGAKVIKPSKAYASEDHPVTKRLAWVPRLADLARGDPDRAAKVMFEVATASRQDFLRVILGSDCWGRVDEKVTELRRTVEAQQELAASTNM